MEAASVISWKPLGELLVERNVVTEADLEAALEEQSTTGERLGAILVNRRIVAGVVLTTLLAEQAGVELETQGGFGTGLFARIAHRNGPQPVPDARRDDASEPACPELRPVPTDPCDPAYEISALRVELEIERARVAQLEEELETIRRKTPMTQAGTPKKTPRRPTSAKHPATS
jgi:hypothetical protein